ncbi:MAG: hypothetical protein NC831_07780 [Candidatus Omnitrophica bacterium]|nr:hypothetical protein [Candidatus Omnitrophota bacterium]MCM8827754.1 hypothetical protein [Candidatus Omnitrophota bacterium]
MREVREIIKDLLGNIQSNIVCSHPLVEAVLLERKNGVTITLTNFSGKKQKNIIVEFVPPEGITVKKSSARMEK